MTDTERAMYEAIRNHINSLLTAPDTAISFLTPHIGTREYDGIVSTIQNWYYGSLVKAPWCATCASYVLSTIYHYNCKHENVYHLNTWAKKSLMSVDSPAEAQENDLVIMSFGTPLAVTSKKHATFFTGKRDASGNLLCLGGNQADSICITAYNPDDIHAIYRPHK